MELRPASERTGILLMLASVVLFAANVLLLRALSRWYPMVDGAMASVVRGWVGLAVVVVAFRGRGFAPGHLLTRPLVLLRGAVGAAGILLFYVTIPHLGAGRSVIINLTYPLFGAGLAAVYLQERLTLTRLGWMGVALVGLGIFFAGDAWSAGVSRWELAGLAGAMVAGVAVVLIRLLRHSEHSSTIYASQCVWSAVAASPWCVGAMTGLPSGAVGGLVLAALLVAGGQLALTESFRTLAVARGSAIQMLLPLITGAGGMVLFGEAFTAWEAVGAAVTLVATWRAVQER